MTCCCDLPDCVGIGYASNMFAIPSEPGHVVEDVIYTLNIKDEAKKSCRQGSQYLYKVAPWHFHLKNKLYHDKDKWWMLITDGRRYVNDEKKVWHDFPPANYSPSKLIEKWETETKKLSRQKKRVLVALDLKLGKQFPAWVVLGNKEPTYERGARGDRGVQQRVLDWKTDAQTQMDLWALESEKRCFQELEEEFGDSKTKLELVEMVLAEDWPTKLRNKFK